MGTPLTDLLTDPGQLGRVTAAIETAVAKSFESHAMRHTTRAEVKRRFDICLRWFRALREEYKWSNDRAADTLAQALAAELNGGTFTPDARSVWMPEDGV